MKRIIEYLRKHEPPWWLSLVFAIPAIAMSILAMIMTSLTR